MIEGSWGGAGRVSALGFRLEGFGFTVWALRFRLQGFSLRVSGFEFGIRASASAMGFRP